MELMAYTFMCLGFKISNIIKLYNPGQNAVHKVLCAFQKEA
jgi:hypothetical protein